MKVSISWLKELVDLKVTIDELIALLPLRSVSIKDVTPDSIELDMKGYNRADLLSMRGVALEVSAITGSKVLFGEPQEADFVWNIHRLPNTKVKVKNPKLCPFYCLAKIEGLRVGPSNEDWVKKLNDSSIRSVNNIADITNLIMLEYGQPLHAFDADKVEHEEIVVRTANPGEELVTLDGKKRTLNPTNLLITDKQKALGLAGVMGGQNSEVTSSTKTILLEAAIFDSVNIRKSAINHGLTSEASKRFQHGLTKKRLLQALDAAIKTYENLGGKVTAITITGNFEDEVKKIKLTQQRINSLIGVEINAEDMEGYLKKLGFTLATQGLALHAWEVTVPYWRLDVNIEEDVIEEIARMYGYERIPPKEVPGVEPLQKEDPIFKKISDLRENLVKAGLTEVQTYSFYSTQVLGSLGLKKENLVKISNPISSETEYLRENIWPNLVEVVGKNLRKGFKDIAIFEIGKAFNVGPDGNPVEDYRLAIALTNGSDNPLLELYQIAQTLGSHLKGIKLNQTKPPQVVTHLFHPKRFVAIEKGRKQIGGVSEVHLRVLNKLGIEKRVAVLEIELERHSYSN